MDVAYGVHAVRNDDMSPDRFNHREDGDPLESRKLQLFAFF